MLIQKAYIEEGKLLYNNLGLIMPNELHQETIEFLSQSVSSDSFIFIQNDPSDTWIIEHPLNKRPSVFCEDLDGTDMEGTVEYINNFKIVVKWIAATSGKAYLN